MWGFGVACRVILGGMGESWRVMREGPVAASWWITWEGGGHQNRLLVWWRDVRDVTSKLHGVRNAFLKYETRIKRCSSVKYTHPLYTCSFYHVTSSVSLLPSQNSLRYRRSLMSLKVSDPPVTQCSLTADKSYLYKYNRTNRYTEHSEILCFTATLSMTLYMLIS